MRVAWAIQGIGYLLLGIILYIAVKDTSPSPEVAQITPMNNTLILRSPAFGNGQPIPSKYTCDGEDMSPPIAIEQIPKGTASLVLIVEDSDAPNGTWDHWVVFNIPPSTTRIAEGEPPAGVQGRSSWNKTTYNGPCPPDGEHRYVFKVYALDTLLQLSEQATKADVLEMMKGHILTTGELTGTYTRL
ncbi:MAG: PEBP family protein [Parcubacteria group bacterium GW2011_GWD2_42_14]|nr:MAG: PEBP family protein [Parcubacteria group bacterium GW2011_GWD2_42_14]